jgi:hypothetical protein
MVVDSRKPKGCVGIASGPNYRFTIACVLGLLLKGPT